MAIHTKLCRTLWLLAAVALAAGCSNPKSNPYVAPPPLREGTPLDVSATHIGNNGGQPWMVNSDWTIEAGRTVEIDPGTTIMFSGTYNVNVDGKIVANGQPDQGMITFTSGFLYPNLGQWGNIRLRNSNPADSSVFRYCVFSYGAHFNDDTSSETSKYYRGMLSIRNSSPVIENCLAIYNQDNAVYLHWDVDSVPQPPAPAPIIRYNVITRNDGSALRTHSGVTMTGVTFTHNALGDNNVIPYLLAETDSSYGFLDTINANLDSVDGHFNLLDGDPPELEAPTTGNYSLTSCSPAVDAGPDGLTDPDGSRRDLGPAPYHQVGDELRGVRTGTLAGGQTYRMSCDVRVPAGEELIIPAGTRIEATGLYNLEVFGRLEIQGESNNRVVICNCQIYDRDVWGGLRFYNLDGANPSVIRNTDIENYEYVTVWTAGTRFEGVRFTGGREWGAVVNTYNHMEMSEAVTFEGCEVADCGIAGIRSYQSPVIIRNSLIHDIKGRGVWLSDLGTMAEITNTVVQSCSTSAVSVDTLTSPRIINCVLANNGYHGLQMTGNCNPVVMNTIIWGNHRKGVYAVGSSWPDMTYNCISGNLEMNLDPDTLRCTDCLPTDANPGFVGGGNFHLTPGSPCIDAGNPDPQYDDANGLGTVRNDQGAYGGPAGGSVGPAMHGPNRMVVQR